MKNDTSTTIFTIPNLLSVFRITLIPLFIWLYTAKQDYLMAAGVLLFSGITDIVDGYIARRFHMISNVGKVLDPAADKLTQLATLYCLLTRFPAMQILMILLIGKELFVGFTGLLVLKKNKEVFGSNWHGKAATFLLYAMIILHVVWHDIPLRYSNFTVALCIIMMTLSLVLYGVRNLRALRNNVKV